MTVPFAGLRVLDLADRSAALAGRILADLGATVTMIEPPTGATIRRHGPRFGDESAAHHYFSANKRSMTVDLATEPDVLRGLVADADVLIDTERPGRLDDLGLGHHALRAVNPRLVQCSVTPFGLHGEWRHWKATDLTSVAAGGLAWLSGEPRGVPVQGGANVAHVMAGLHATSGIAVALHHRDHGDGSGVHLDLSVQEAVVMAAMQTATPTHWAWHGHIPRRPGLSNALRCADGGYVGHLVRPDRFPAFLAWAEQEGIDHAMTVDDWAWSRLDAPRKDNPVAATTLALAAKLTRDEFAAGALEADIVCLPVLGLEDLDRTEQFVANDQFVEVEHPRLGGLGFVRSPVDGMREPITIRPAPDRGADDDARPAPLAPAPAPGTPPVGDPARALAGLRIVDFTWVLAGPLGTRLLADFGADVIRVESTTKPDSMRSQIGPDGVPDPDLGGLHNSVNTGKRSLAVDLRDPRGRQLVDELIDTADVVVDNFRPGALARMGFDYDTLRQRNPGIVVCHLPGAHPRGPWAGRPSMGNILMAASGFNLLTGFEGERPRGIGVAYPDFTGPHLLATTVLAAVHEQRRTGVGQEITIPQLSGMVAMLGAEWLAYRASGAVPPRRANRDDDHAPHGIFPARPGEHSDDEWIAVAVAGDDEWQALAGLVDPTLGDDPRFRTHVDRKANEDALDAVIRTWTAGHDKWELAAQLQAAGIAAAPVEHLADTYGLDPQLRHHYQHLRQPSRPDLDVPVDREPVRWVGADHRLTRSPGVGEHGHEIVCGVLGRSDEEFAGLLADGVLA